MYTSICRSIRSAPPMRQRCQYSDSQREHCYSCKSSIQENSMASTDIKNVCTYPSFHHKRQTKSGSDGKQKINTSPKQQLRRTVSSNVTSRDHWIDGYYRPMTSPGNRKMRKKTRSVCYSDGDQYPKEGKEEDMPSSSTRPGTHNS